MIDAYGRHIEYLRLSLTERCNLNCIYCREPGAQTALPQIREITPREIEAVMTALVPLGVNKVRLTGGEPLMRHDLADVARAACAGGTLSDLCITTNAQGLRERAKAVHDAGVMRANISLDSLDPEKFRAMTRGGELQRTLDGIEAALDAGFSSVKLNVVLVRGRNDGEVDDFIALAQKRPIDVRFIELMPFGTFGREEQNRVSNAELLAARPYLRPVAPRYEGQPSADYAGEGFLGRVGFISPMSHRFCNTCNRIRITSDAMLKPCLGSNLEVPLRPAIEAGGAALLTLLQKTIYEKPEGHHFNHDFASDRGMSRIGG